MKLFLLTVWMIVGISCGAILWKVDLNNEQRDERADLEKVRVDLGNLHDQLTALRQAEIFNHADIDARVRKLESNKHHVKCK